MPRGRVGGLRGAARVYERGERRQFRGESSLNPKPETLNPKP